MNTSINCRIVLNPEQLKIQETGHQYRSINNEVNITFLLLCRFCFCFFLLLLLYLLLFFFCLFFHMGISQYSTYTITPEYYEIFFSSSTFKVIDRISCYCSDVTIHVYKYTYVHSLWDVQTRIYRVDKHAPWNPSNGIRPGMYRYNAYCTQAN